MFETPDFKSLINTAEADFADKSVNLPLRFNAERVLARVLAGGLNGAYGYLRYVAGQVFPWDMKDSVLSNYAKWWGISRNPPNVASGFVTVSFTQNATLSEGTVIRGQSNNISYTITETKSGTAGGDPVKFAVSCDLAGSVGNLDAGDAFTLVSPIIGIGTIIAADGGISGGLEVESDDNLRNRLQLRINNPNRIGRKVDFEYWAIQTGGVTHAWCLPWRDRVGGIPATGISEHVMLIVLADFTQDHLKPTDKAIALANANVLNYCQAQILPKCVAIKTVPVNITLSIRQDTPTNRDAVTTALRKMYHNPANFGVPVPVSKILTALANIPGITEFNVISPTGAANNNPPVSSVQIHVLGQVTFQ